MAQQNRNEKKLIEEAIRKVREVVHTASKNDIVLALHNYDFDVTKTIQAFCDDGAQSALESWKRSGTGGNKKKNQKKKKTSSNAAAAVTKTIPISTTSLPPALPKAVNGAVVIPQVNDIAEITNAGSGSESALMNASKNEQIVADVDPPKLLSGSSVSVKEATIVEDVRNFDNDHISQDSSWLKDHNRQIEKVEVVFENEISAAEENVRNSFKCIRQILAERESHLLAELRRTYDEGTRYFSDRRVLSNELDERSSRMSAMSDREQADLQEEIARFFAERQTEEEIAHTIRFHCDNAQLIKLVKNFGEVVAVKAMNRSMTGAVARQTPLPTYAMKHSNSHSSVVSSVGEDSGLGQISPIGNEERKDIAEVSNGGILMKSDALTTEQLSDLNKKLQESLKAQGIDASVLFGIGNRNAMPTRRRPPASGRFGQSNGARGGRGGPRGGSARTQLVRVPNLSILQS